MNQHYYHNISKTIKKIYYLSDLHLEHKQCDDFSFIIPTLDKSVGFCHNQTNILILAGDIGNPMKESYWKFLQCVSKIFCFVFLVTGNHEYYGSSIETIDKLIMKGINELKLFNVNFMNNRVIHFENVKFIGTTLWTHIPKEKEEIIRNYMNDYRLIQNLTPSIVSEKHLINRKFIEKALSEKTSQYTIVITHHAPLINGTSHPSHNNSTANEGFATDLPDLIDKSDYWIYGHTHFNQNNINKLYTNQLGYGNQARGFNKNNYIKLC